MGKFCRLQVPSPQMIYCFDADAGSQRNQKLIALRFGDFSPILVWCIICPLEKDSNNIPSLGVILRAWYVDSLLCRSPVVAKAIFLFVRCLLEMSPRKFSNHFLRWTDNPGFHQSVRNFLLGICAKLGNLANFGFHFFPRNTIIELRDYFLDWLQYFSWIFKIASALSWYSFIISPSFLFKPL